MKIKDAYEKLTAAEKAILEEVETKLSDEQRGVLSKLLTTVERPQFLLTPSDIKERCTEYHQLLKAAKFRSSICPERQKLYDSVYLKHRKHDKDKTAHGKALRAAANEFNVLTVTIRRTVKTYEH